MTSTKYVPSGLLLSHTVAASDSGFAQTGAPVTGLSLGSVIRPLIRRIRSNWSRTDPSPFVRSTPTDAPP